MGVRFACHACGKRLNIKTELAGKRGICPACSVKFRIPAYDTELSTPLEVDATPSIQSESSARSIVSAPQSQSLNSTSSTAPVETSVSSGVAVRDSPQQQDSPKEHHTGHDRHIGQDRQTERDQHTERDLEAGELLVESKSTDPALANRDSLEQMLGGPSATWYVRPPSGGQYGPADGPTMGQWLNEGRVADVAMVWRDGWTDWRHAKDALPGIVPTISRESPPVRNGAATLIESTVAGELERTRQNPLEVASRPGTLVTNKKRRSRNRVVASVALGIVCLSLVAALIFVLIRD